MIDKLKLYYRLVNRTSVPVGGCMTLHSLKKKLPNIKVYLKEGALHLEGEVDNYETFLSYGKLAVKLKSRGVVNDLTIKGLKAKPMREPNVEDSTLEGKHCDVLIIGAGIVGCAIARELSKSKVSILVLDKENDVAVRASSRNDGMVHPGIDIHPGLKKAKYNSRGNRLYTMLSKELNFDFIRNGSYIVLPKPWMKFVYPIFWLRAKQNGVDGIAYVSKKKLSKLEINVAPWQCGAVYTPSSGIISPYKVTIALAENAALNGAEFSFETVVRGFEKEGEEIIKVRTNKGVVYPKVVINAAGVYSDTIAQMADDRFFSIHPRKGTEIILDKEASSLTSSVIAKLPFGDVKNHTKGGGLVRTIDKNMLVGPNAVETIEREDDSTTKEDVEAIFEKHKKVVPSLTERQLITYFSGTRASTWEEDFIVEKSKKVNNLIHAAGIQSPGVTAAPAIAEDIARFAKEILTNVEMKENFIASNPYHPILSKLSLEEKDRLIKQDPSYGRIVCRCEEISEGEIRDALLSPLPFTPTLDAVKRRCRAGMGRCQGGFCSPRVFELIHELRGIETSQIKKGQGLFAPFTVKEDDK